jgi:hypothetical protein
MTTLLAEQPIVVSIMMMVTAIALLYAWLRTGQTPAAIAGLIILVLIPAAWLVSSRWVTDRERIKEVLHATADAVEANDHDRVVALISEDRPDTIEQARRELPRYVFDEADITGIHKISIIEGTYPQEADVDLNAKVLVTDRRGRFNKLRVLRRVKLRLQKIDIGGSTSPRWVVIDYTHMPITGKPDSFSP